MNFYVKKTFFISILCIKSIEINNKISFNELNYCFVGEIF